MLSFQYLLNYLIMAFLNSLPSRKSVPIIGSDNIYSRVGTSSPIKNFIDSFGGTVRPTSLLSLDPSFNFEINIGSTSKGDGPPKPPSSNGKSKSGSRPHKSYAYRKLEDRSSASLSFNSGIKSGLLIDPREDNVYSYSTLFVMAGSFLSENNKQSVAYKFMDDLTYLKYLSCVQNRINYRVDSDFTSSKFYTYIRSITAALQLYYYVDSILAYNNNEDIPIKNVGMEYLRSQFTAEILSQHALLGLRLKSYALPPRILDFVRYMYQNFTLTDDISSPIIRLAFRETLHEGDHIRLSPEYYDVIIEEIKNVGSRIPNLLRNTFPEMIFNSMPLSSSYPIHDRNFKTFWCNSSVTYMQSSLSEVKHTRTVRDSSQNFNYYTFMTSEYDGLFAASNSIYNTDKDCFYSGIWNPIYDSYKFKMFPEDCRSSVLCYHSGDMRMRSLASTSTLSQSGMYHGVYYDTSAKKYFDELYVPAGSLKYQVCSFDMINQAMSYSIEYLLDLPRSK